MGYSDHAFNSQKTGELHPDILNVMETAAKLIDIDGIDAWHDCDINNLINDADDYEKVTDVLDVWFESGVSHACVLEARKELKVPADLYLEGSDQHRGWFQSSLLTSVAMRDNAPYKSVLTHGYVVDALGRKMSKSVGNTISPADIVKNHGADVLRLWAMSVDHTDDMSVSDEILNAVAMHIVVFATPCVFYYPTFLILILIRILSMQKRYCRWMHG